jgi:hypothetical protein
MFYAPGSSGPTGASGLVEARQNPILGWELGDPATEHGPTWNVTDLTVLAGVYARAFANGLVVVNPGSVDMATPLALNETYVEIDQAGGGVARKVSQVLLKKHTAVILLKKAPKR